MTPERTSACQVALLMPGGAAALAVFCHMPAADQKSVADAVARVGPLAIVPLVALGIVDFPVPGGADAFVARALCGTLRAGVLAVACDVTPPGPMLLLLCRGSKRST